MKKALFGAVVAFCGLLITTSHVSAQGTAFTYQGRLNSGANPATGLFDFTFALNTTSSGNSQMGSTLTETTVGVTNGLFTVTLDFDGGAPFNGTPYYLQIGVRTNGAVSFTPLTPRQLLTPAPYAIYAEGVNASGITGPVPSANLSGTYSSPVTLNNAGNVISGNGAGLTGINATDLGGVGAGNFWQQGGNNVSPGQFLGSTNYQPVEIWAGGLRVMRFEPTSIYFLNDVPNIIGGSVANFVALGVGGAFIGGGGEDGFSTNSIGYGGNNAVIGGGYDNSVSSQSGFIGAGNNNTLQPGTDGSLIGGGSYNTVQANDPGNVIVGGFGNTNAGVNAVIGGGVENLITNNPDGAVIPGGQNNVAAGANSFAAGQHAQAMHDGAFVWADNSTTNSFASTGSNQFLIRASGGVGIGTTAPAAPLHVVNTNLSTTSAGIYGFTDGGSTASTHPLGYYTGGGEFAGANGLIAAATTNQTDGYGMVALAPGTGGRGVYGRAYSLSGITYGVYGESDSTNGGAGVYGTTTSSNGAGVYAKNASSTGPALAISGGIQIVGAGNSTPTAAFVVVSASTNFFYSNAVRINNPLCNGRTNALLFITHNISAQTAYAQNNHPIGVWYDGSYWEIINEDAANMPTNIAFNVLVINP